MNNGLLEKIHNDIRLMKIKTYTELVDYFIHYRKDHRSEEIEFILNHVDHFVAYFDKLVIEI